MKRRLVLLLALASCNPSVTPDASLPDAGADASALPSPGDVFDGPARLSETGLYADLAAGMLVEGVVPYDVRFELWSDGADKARWLFLPPGTRIDTSDPDAWVFPVGTRAWKEFRSGGVRIETRFLHKVAPDRWENVAYVWRPDGTDADARPEGLSDAHGTEHDVPDTRACFDCHRGVDGLIGVSAIQLGDSDALLDRLSAPVDGTIPGSPLEQSALGYLHANCGHCHGGPHPLTQLRSLRLRLPVGLGEASEAPVLQTALNAAMHHAVEGATLGIVPGAPLESQLYVRMQHRGDGWEMPPRGTERVDEEASALIRAWIEALP